MQRLGRGRIASLFVVLGIARPPGAQTVRPAVVEYVEQARGKFELVNETLFPLTVVVEPRGFHVEPKGDLIEEVLDTTRIQVKISAMSFRVPRARRTPCSTRPRRKPSRRGSLSRAP